MNAQCGASVLTGWMSQVDMSANQLHALKKCAIAWMDSSMGRNLSFLIMTLYGRNRNHWLMLYVFSLWMMSWNHHLRELFIHLVQSPVSGRVSCTPMTNTDWDQAEWIENSMWSTQGAGAYQKVTCRANGCSWFLYKTQPWIHLPDFYTYGMCFI